MTFRGFASSVVAAVTSVAAVSITGLNQPTSVAWDDAGRVFISELAGVIKIAPNFASTSASMLIDLRNQTAFFGDLGLEAVEWADGYLWAAYMVSNFTSCSDNGAPNGRSANQTYGCLAYGRISRWPVPNGIVMGPEQRIIDETTRPGVCNQFRVGPIDYMIAGNDGYIYAAAGVGANGQAIDRGQFGTNPCGTGAAWGGAFRAQDALSLDGKIFRINVTSRAVDIIAQGFNNPYRFTMGPGGIYSGDTGSDTYEEINGPINIINPATGVNALNFGFPCYESNNTLAGYQALNSSVCAALTPAMVQKPMYAYGPPDNSTRIVVSALAYANSTQRFYYGDYMQSRIFSVGLDGTGVKVEKAFVWPVDIADVPGVGLVYVDVVKGAVKSVASVPVPSNGATAYSILGLIFSVLAVIVTYAL